MPAVKKATNSKKKISGRKTADKRSARVTNDGRTIGDYGNALIARLGTAGAAGAIVVIVITVGILWAGGYIGLFFESTTKFAERQIAATMVGAGLDVKKIVIVGRDNTSTQAIEDALGNVEGTSMLHFDPHTARARIEEIGWVRAASVSRLWPNQISISLRERNPAAVWQVSGTLRLVDRDGAIIREIGAYEYSGLPLIVGTGAPEAAAGILASIEEVKGFGNRITALVRVSDRRWNLRIGETMDVKLPEFGFQQAIRDLAILNDTVGVLDHDFEYIDLRDPERTYFQCRGDAAGTKTTAQDLLAAGFTCTGSTS